MQQNINIKEQAKLVKIASPIMAGTSEELRNKALKEIAIELENHKEEIFEANKKDLEQAKKDNVQQAIVKRLKFDEGKLRDVVAGINDLIGLSDPLHKKTLQRQLDSDLLLIRETCPIGVIGIIF